LTISSINESAVSYRTDILKSMLHLRNEIEDIIETIEVLSDQELLEGLKRSIKELESGNVYELADVDDLDELWSEE